MVKDRLSSLNKLDCTAPAEANEAAGDQLVDLRDLAKPEGKSALKPGQVAMRYGVLATPEHDQLRFHIQVDGKDQTLFVLDAKDEAARDAAALEANKRLREITQAKQEELEAKYHVAFSRQNEDVEKQITKVNVDNTFERSDAMIHARTPRLDEIYGIEAALKHSAPSYVSKDGKQPVKFYFLEDQLVKGDKSSTLANYVNKDKDSRPAVYFWPNSSSSRPITEEDLKKNGLPEEYSIESLLTHELGHSSQYRLGWDNSEKLEKLSNDMGWAPYEDPNTHETVWLIKGNGDDRYKLAADGEQWLRTNKAGDLVDKAGNPVKEEKDAEHLSPSDVRKKALIPPPSDYFDNACEMAAEGFMMFRTSAERRKHLMETSPEFYTFIKAQDQADINVAFGTKADGNPEMIRNKDGNLVENNGSNRQAVTDFESGNLTGK